MACTLVSHGNQIKLQAQDTHKYELKKQTWETCCFDLNRGQRGGDGGKVI